MAASSSCTGFGLRSVVIHAPGAYLASVNNNLHIQETTATNLGTYLAYSENQLQKYKGYSPNPDRTESDYSKLIDNSQLEYLESTLPLKQVKRLQSCKAPHALAWLHAPPCRAQGVYFSDAQF
jgi:hypothetical protein